MRLFAALSAAWVAAEVRDAAARPGLQEGGVGSEQETAEVRLRVTNLVPRFLEFHAEATRRETAARARAGSDGVPVDEDALREERERSWRNHLPELDEIVRAGPGLGSVSDGLSEAWPLYPSAMPHIRSTTDGLETDAREMLLDLTELLRLERPLQLHLVLYVGDFGGAPSFRLHEGEYAVLLPVEILPTPVEPVLVDLFTRALHARLAGRPPPGEALSFGEHLAIRGLALRAHEMVDPGRRAEEYLRGTRSWLLEAEAHDGAILEWIRRNLGERDSRRVAELLGGEGEDRFPGDVDYAAWRISGLFLTHGWTLDRLAHEPLEELESRVAEVVGR